jgi:hypothetical protein
MRDSKRKVYRQYAFGSAPRIEASLVDVPSAEMIGSACEKFSRLSLGGVKCSMSDVRRAPLQKGGRIASSIGA